MRQHRRLILALLLATFVAACQRATEFSSADEAAIRATIDEYVRAALAADWPAWGKTLGNDVVYMPPNHAPLIGREAAVAFAKTFPKLTSFTVTVEDVSGRGDLAYARGKYSFAGTLPDGSNVSENGSFLEVHRRQPDGTWPYTHAIWHSDAPPLSSAPLPAR